MLQHRSKTWKTSTIRDHEDVESISFRHCVLVLDQTGCWFSISAAAFNSMMITRLSSLWDSHDSDGQIETIQNGIEFVFQAVIRFNSLYRIVAILGGYSQILGAASCSRLPQECDMNFAPTRQYPYPIIVSYLDRLTRIVRLIGIARRFTFPVLVNQSAGGSLPMGLQAQEWLFGMSSRPQVLSP
jgi:hypothetical protein